MDLKYQIDLLEKRLKALEEENERLITERWSLAAQAGSLKKLVSQIKEMPEPRTFAERREEEALWRQLNHICGQVPQQILREIEAKAGLAGFVAGYNQAQSDPFTANDTEIDLYADEYAESVRAGEK